MTNPQKLRVLCLHGMYQNAESFRAKTKHLHGIHEQIEYVYANGPFQVIPKILQRQQSRSSKLKKSPKVDENQFRGWWPPESPTADDRSILVNNLTEILEDVGPIDGLLGFSQGASLAAWLSTQQAMEELKWKPSFVVLFGAYCAAPEIQPGLSAGVQHDIPSLHVFGSNDYVISAAKSRQVVSIFHSSQKENDLTNTCIHDQGHVVPKAPHVMEALDLFYSMQLISSIHSKATPDDDDQNQLFQ